MSQEYICSVNKILPNNGEQCFCYGYKTYCCKEDMDTEPDWHEVIFKFVICEYKLKNEIPKDPEESILENIIVTEYWELVSNVEQGHVIGVSLWKRKS